MKVEFTPCETLEDLARAYQREANHFRRVALLFAAAGTAMLLLALGAPFIVKVWMASLDSVESAALMVLVGGVVLYPLQVIAKQLVGTREMIYAMSVRGKQVQGARLILDQARDVDDDTKKKLLERSLDLLVSPVDSPFAPGRVAGSADMESILGAMRRSAG